MNTTGRSVMDKAGEAFEALCISRGEIVDDRCEKECPDCGYMSALHDAIGASTTIDDGGEQR